MSTDSPTCAPCVSGRHEKCWKEWAYVDLGDLTMSRTLYCGCDQEGHPS